MRNLGEDSSKRLQLWGKYEMKKEKASSKRHYFDRFELDLDNDGPNVHLDFLYDEKTDKEPIKSHKTNPNFAFSNINKSGSFPLEQNSKGKGKRHVMYLLNKRETPPTQNEIDYILAKRPRFCCYFLT